MCSRFYWSYPKVNAYIFGQKDHTLDSLILFVISPLKQNRTLVCLCRQRRFQYTRDMELRSDKLQAISALSNLAQDHEFTSPTPPKTAPVTSRRQWQIHLLKLFHLLWAMGPVTGPAKDDQSLSAAHSSSRLSKEACGFKFHLFWVSNTKGFMP